MQECEKGISNLLNAIQAGSLAPSTKDSLEQLEAQKNLQVSILRAMNEGYNRFFRNSNSISNANTLKLTAPNKVIGTVSTDPQHLHELVKRKPIRKY